MKKFLVSLLILVLCLGITGCSENNTRDEKTLLVAATAKPHGEILDEAKKILSDEYGIDLEVKILDDFFIFNKSLDNGDVDANFFQHVPFFEDEVKKNGYDIVNAGAIHIEPFGFYSKSITTIDQLKKGDEIIISNSVADHGRILAILDQAGIIKLKKNVAIQLATLEDIEENPLQLKFTEIKPELLTTVFSNNEGALVAINGNYAIDAGLNPTKDAILLEKASKDNPYVNIIACQKEHVKDKKIEALVKVLKSKQIKNFIENRYSDGSVIPVK